MRRGPAGLDPVPVWGFVRGRVGDRQPTHPAGFWVSARLFYPPTPPGFGVCIGSELAASAKTSNPGELTMVKGCRSG